MVILGRIPGSLLASMLLPEPGGPIINTLWFPAAAISRARLTVSCPFTSEKSTEPGFPIRFLGSVGGVSSNGGGSTLPSITSAASRRSRTGTILTPSTAFASNAFTEGTMSPLVLRSRANREIANAPRTGRTSPSKASSPITIHSAKRSLQICPEQANNPNAIGRSKHGPAFLRSAGARLAVMKPSGQKYPLFQTAAFTRCRDSFTAVSAKPTTTKFSFPFPASTSTSTGRASTPTTAADQVLAIFLIGSIPHPLH